MSTLANNESLSSNARTSWIVGLKRSRSSLKVWTVRRMKLSTAPSEESAVILRKSSRNWFLSGLENLLWGPRMTKPMARVKTKRPTKKWKATLIVRLRKRSSMTPKTLMWPLIEGLVSRFDFRQLERISLWANSVEAKRPSLPWPSFLQSNDVTLLLFIFLMNWIRRSIRLIDKPLPIWFTTKPTILTIQHNSLPVLSDRNWLRFPRTTMALVIKIRSAVSIPWARMTLCVSLPTWWMRRRPLGM